MNMIFVGIYNKVFLLLSITILLYVLFISKEKRRDSVFFLLAFAFSIGCNYRFHGFSLGQILMALITVLGCACSIKRRNTGYNIGTIKANIVLFTMYYCATTIIGYIVCMNYRVIGSAIQNELRPIMQIFQLVALMCTVMYTLNLDRNESIRILNAFSSALFIIAILGVIHWLIYFIFKIDIFPILRGSIAVSAVTDSGFIRACSCVGEPKHFAKYMAIGISLELFCRDYTDKRINFLKIILYSVCIIMTASATGVIIAAAAVALYIYMKTQKKGLAIIGIIFVIITIIVAIRVPFVASKIAYHVERGQIPGLEDCDTAVVRWLINEPLYGVFGVGMANTVAFANSYAPPGVEGISKFLFTLRRGIIQYMSEGGLIGTFLVISVFNSFIKRAKGNRLLKYEIIFLVLMNLFLTLEAITGLQFLLIALISNVAGEPVQEKIEEKENDSVTFCNVSTEVI